MHEVSKSKSYSKQRLIRPWTTKRLAILLRVLGVNSPFVFGTSITRVLVEALLIATLFFVAAANSVLIPDYRLIFLAYLPGGLLAVIWTALRLRRLVNRPIDNWKSWAKGSGITIGIGLILGGLLVADYLLVSSLYYPIQNLTKPKLPSLLNPIESNSGVIQVFLSFEWIISGPTQLAADTPAFLSIALRLGFLMLELTLFFLMARLGWWLLALPATWIKRQAAKRLLWQLTLSHFSVVLVSLTTAILSIGIFVIPIYASNGVNAISPARQLPAYEARLIVDTVSAAQKGNNPLVNNNLQTFLEILDQNSYLDKLANPNPFSNELSSQTQNLIRQLRSTAALSGFIAVVGTGGQLIVSTNVERFNSAMNTNKADLQQLLARSSAGETNLDRLVTERVQPNVFIAGAYPFKTDQNKVQLSLLVVEPPEIVLSSSSRLLGVLIVAGLFFTIAILIASFFTLFVALVFGYLVSRRLVQNLEKLTGAADALAAGNLEQRVALPIVQDEVGRLGSRFNYMADRLQESQANLAEEKKVVEQALQTKRELVANVSHELRTPVSTIRAHVDWLLHNLENRKLNASSLKTGITNGVDTLTLSINTGDGDLEQYLGIIERETYRLSEMIDDLLDLSQLEAQHTKIKLEAVAIAELGQEIKQSLGLMAQRERKVILTLDIAPNLPLVLADRTRLSQILINLVRNGINYTPAGGIVSLGAKAMPETHSVMIWVADTGIGISPTDLELIFERFYRSDASRSRHSGGAGLGLTIVKTLVEAMGGSLSVESVLDEGSKFSLVLPTTEC